MIPLSFSARISGHSVPFVVRLNSDWMPGFGAHDCFIKEVKSDQLTYKTPYGDLVIKHGSLDELDGDVLLVVPERATARRLIRAASSYNTLLITEQCDQLCVMCSQPPKKHHVDLFAYYETAIPLAPAGAVIGISGGEPTLHKDQLLSLMIQSLKVRPDLSFQVLSNGQHFERSDIRRLSQLPPGKVLWGIPLYSSVDSTHDAIVKKDGAFKRLGESFSILYEAGALIELRTVLIKDNVLDLTEIARFITTQIPFVFRWAVMQLERIGYGRQNWAGLFYDNSTAFAPIANALDLAIARGIAVQLFNFPLCTVPPPYRKLAPSTISDWKRRFVPICEGCSARDLCGGFFQWYEESSGFKNLGRL